jgi:hypothetical protein
MLEIVSYSKLNNDEKTEFIAEFSKFPSRIRQHPWRENILPEGLLQALLANPLPVAKDLLMVKDGVHLVACCSVNVSLSDANLGYFGTFDLDLSHTHYPDAASLLLQHAEAWLKMHNAKRIIGPIAFSTWFPYRWRTQFTDLFVADWEPGQPREYAECAIRAGYTESTKFQSTASGQPQKILELLTPEHESLLNNGFSFEALKASEIKSAHLVDLHNITHEAFAGGFLFDPIPQPIFEGIYLPMINSSKHDVRIIFCVNREGIRCGYLVGFFQNRALVLKSVANARSRTGSGAKIFNPMIVELLRWAIPAGINQIQCALMRDDNRSMQFSERMVREGGEIWRHHYSLFEKSLA